ncbi:MAG: FadR/GntR family transcriptional regulator [Kineosporiaceae bacterium]
MSEAGTTDVDEVIEGSAGSPHVGAAPAARPEGPLRTARRAGLIDQVIAQLREQISSGRWQVGDRIPTEAELAASTGTSRNTVREAVQSLVHAGLLDRRQGSGTYVTASSELQAAVSRSADGVGRRHVLEVRRALEVAAARIAATRRTPEDVALLRDLLARRSELFAAGDLEAAVSVEVRLHQAVGSATHNPLLAELYENVLHTLRDNIAANMAAWGLDTDEHVALVDAIEAGDPDAAAREMACFIDELLDDAG